MTFLRRRHAGRGALSCMAITFAAVTAQPMTAWAQDLEEGSLIDSSEFDSPSPDDEGADKKAKGKGKGKAPEGEKADKEDEAPPAAEPASPPPPAASPPATQAAPAPVTDDEVKKFAKAALAADKISKDTAIAAADKQKKMSEAVTASGLEPTRFNQIAQASQADSALQQKVQAAIVAEQQASPAPTPTQ